MKSVVTLLLYFFFCVSGIAIAQQQDNPRRVYFEFINNSDVQTLVWNGNTEQLDSVFAIFPTADSLMVANLPLQVESYCGVLSTKSENLARAEASAQSVVEQLIAQKKLTPTHFATRLISEPYKDDDEAVVVRIEIFQIPESLLRP